MSVSPTALLVTGPLEIAVRGYLRGLNYAPCYLVSTVDHLERHGTAAGAPGLEPGDVDAVNALVARHTGDAESDPAGWPGWTDDDRWEPTEPQPPVSSGGPEDDAPFEPTPEDRAAWAAECERLESARENREIDRRAAESAAVDALQRGLIPPDLAAEIARTSRVGHPE